MPQLKLGSTDLVAVAHIFTQSKLYQRKFCLKQVTFQSENAAANNNQIFIYLIVVGCRTKVFTL
jgi:hypothetical protein